MRQGTWYKGQMFHVYLEAHDNNGVMACTYTESGGTVQKYLESVTDKN